MAVRRTWMRGSGPPVPMLEFRAPDPGPAAAVVANIHGDETTGTAIVHALARVLSRELRAGRCLLVPSLNPEGLAAGTRLIPGDACDPNRAFPGDGGGGPAARHAARVWAALMRWRPGVLVDLHADSGAAIPYAIVDRAVRGAERAHVERRCLELASASGFTVLREYPRDRYLRYGLDRSLPGALVNGAGIPAVTLEVGPRRRVDARAIEEGLAAVLGVLTEAGLASRPAPRHRTRRAGGPWRRENGPRTSSSGLLVPAVPPGAELVPGRPIAEVREVGGAVREVLVASEEGFVVAFPDVGHVGPGTTCATVAVPDRDPPAG